MLALINITTIKDVVSVFLLIVEEECAVLLYVKEDSANAPIPKIIERGTIVRIKRCCGDLYKTINGIFMYIHRINPLIGDFPTVTIANEVVYSMTQNSASLVL
jgi:hypothetical protein